MREIEGIEGRGRWRVREGGRGGGGGVCVRGNAKLVLSSSDGTIPYYHPLS